MKQKPTERPVRVGLISLGCAKNLVDGEIMLGTLLKDGVEIIRVLHSSRDIAGLFSEDE